MDGLASGRRSRGWFALWLLAAAALLAPRAAAQERTLQVWDWSEDPDANFGMTTLPPGPSGSRRAVTGWVNMIAIPSGAKNPDLAWQWVAYFTSLEGQLKFFEIYERAGVPRYDFFETDAWSAYVRRYPFIEILPHLLDSAREYPFIKYREINGILSPLFQRVVAGDLAPAAALEEGERLANLLFHP